MQCPNCHYLNRPGAKFCQRCGTKLAQPAILGREYRVVEVITSGGMGAVYKADSEGRFYAVKEMLDTFTSPRDRQDAVNRFLAEALILARLSHPHIPQVHRHFVENERYYLVMDFVEGEDLQTILNRQGGRGLPENQVLDWALQICDVLEYLHGHVPPVVFRDLKPANVMLRPDGQIMLIDFGIARLFNPARQGTMIGTPGYAAPEQYQGLAEPRSDIFALGATLHHLLSGRNPQDHPPFSFPPVTTVNPAITSTMNAVIEKALRMNLEERWASIREFRDALMPLLGPFELEPGAVLAGRYRITEVAESTFSWSVTTFEAIDLQTGARCQGIPMGKDPVEDRQMRRLAALRHRALPRMEIVADLGVACFVSYVIEGIPLDSATIQNPSQLISIGLQLCDFLETTGSHGAGFSWVHLLSPHILLGSQGQVSIDGFEYCCYCISELRSHHDPERPLPPLLSLRGLQHTPGRGNLLQEDMETAEVEIVGTVLAFALMGEHPLYTFDSYYHFLALREEMHGILPHLEQAILGAAAWGFQSARYIQTIAQLRQHLLGRAEGPARATISAQRVKFGKVPWGECPTRSVRLSSRSPGLLYGEIECKQPGLETKPLAFVKPHPAQIEIEITLDTSKLQTCGSLEDEILITTGVDSFQIVVQANVQPDASFSRTQARCLLGNQEWSLALQHCDIFVTLEPSDSEGYWLRGEAHCGLAIYSDAVNDYAQAIRLNPEEAAIYDQRGTAYVWLHQYDLAIQDYSEAIRLEPQEPQYYWNRSIAYEWQGQRNDAIANVQEYLSLGGEDQEDAQRRISDLG